MLHRKLRALDKESTLLGCLRSFLSAAAAGLHSVWVAEIKGDVDGRLKKRFIWALLPQAVLPSHGRY